jgi:hypothetical protein
VGRGMAWMRATLAGMLMLTVWVATAAAGLIIVGKAAMVLLVAAAREPTASAPAGGWWVGQVGGGDRGLRERQGEYGGKKLLLCFVRK